MKKYILIPLSVLLSCVFLISIIFNVAFVINARSDEIKLMTKDEFLTTYAKTSNGAKLELPIIEINTEDEKFPQDKENYVNCSFKISNTENGAYDLEKPMADSPKADGGVGIRLRGNFTLFGLKKPFRIKFNEKTSLMGLEKNKSWVLLADWYDSSKIRNYAGLTLAGKMDNLEWTPTPHHVVVFINNEFHGLYLLTEQIDENAGRTNVKQSVPSGFGEYPFLVEVTKPGDNQWNEIDIDIDGLNGLFAEIKYPEAEDAEGEQDYKDALNYIDSYMKAMWQSLKTGHETEFMGETKQFEELIDVMSLVDYYLVNEIMSNGDVGWRSTYVCKRVGEKARFGPVWDFDIVSEVERLRGCALFKAFLSNSTYFDLVCSRFNEVKDTINNLVGHLTEYKTKIEVVAKIDAKQWYKADTFSENYDNTCQVLINKKNILEGVFSLPHDQFVEVLNNQ